MSGDFRPIGIYFEGGRFLGESEADLDTLRTRLLTHPGIIYSHVGTAIEQVALMRLGESVGTIATKEMVSIVEKDNAIKSVGQLSRQFRNHWLTVAQAGCAEPQIQNAPVGTGLDGAILFAKVPKLEKLC